MHKTTDDNSIPALKFAVFYPAIMSYIGAIFIAYDAFCGYVLKSHNELGLKKLIERFISRKDIPALAILGAVDSLYLSLPAPQKPDDAIHKANSQNTINIKDEVILNNRERKMARSHAEAIENERAYSVQTPCEFTYSK